MRKIFISGLIALALAAYWMMPVKEAHSSSHREAPLISFSPAVDNTDVYAFISPDDPSKVTLVANFSPMQEPAAGPNFFRFADEAAYKILVDNDGDARDEIEIKFTFETTIVNGNTFLYNTGPISSLDDPDYNVRQSYKIRYRNFVTDEEWTYSSLAVPPVNIGPASTPNYESLASAAVYDLGNEWKVFAGQRDDPFYVDLGAVFDLLTIRPGAPGNTGGGVDGLGGFNCNTIAIQAPISAFTKDGSTPVDAADPFAVIAVRSTTELPRERILRDGKEPRYKGKMTQVSRLAMPLVNETVIPLQDKDRFNNSHPLDDTQFLNYVLDPEPARLLNLLYGLNVPPAPRNDLVAVFLTGVDGLNQPPDVTPSEQIRLNLAIAPTVSPSPYGVLAGDVAGFPNGRRPGDDVVDIAFRVLAGVLVPGFDGFPNNALGDGVDQNDLPFLTTFPYLATPHQGFEHDHHRIEPVHAATGSQPAANSGASSESAGIPDQYALDQNYPNPFNPSTTIRFELPEAGNISLRVYNVRGQLVKTLIESPMEAGSHNLLWDGTNNASREVASGMYFYRLEAENYVKARQMILTR